MDKVMFKHFQTDEQMIAIYHNPNNVREENFNDTLNGYLDRALAESGISDEEQVRVRRGMCVSLDMMTMEEARAYYLR